jgi:hypothetical protein
MSYLYVKWNSLGCGLPANVSDIKAPFALLLVCPSSIHNKLEGMLL